MYPRNAWPIYKEGYVEFLENIKFCTVLLVRAGEASEYMRIRSTEHIPLRKRVNAGTLNRPPGESQP